MVLRILFVTVTFSETQGGPLRSALGLLNGLQGLGVNTWLLSLRPKGFKNSLTRVKGVFYGHKHGYGSYKNTVVDCVRHLKPNLVYIHGVWNVHCHAAVVVCRKLNIPYIIAPRGSFLRWSLQQKAWKKCVAMWLYQRQDIQKSAGLHVTSQAELKALQKLFPDVRVFCVPNGVKLPEELPARIRRKDGKKTVLFLARLHHGKGLMALIEAWKELLGSSEKCSEGEGEGNSHKDTESSEKSVKTGQLTTDDLPLIVQKAEPVVHNWHVEYAGSDCGGYFEKVQARIRELGLEEHFTYLGELDDEEKWVAYRRADLFVLPTHSENFGIVVAEALAAGVPVITTKGAPWSELLGSSDECSVFSVQCSEGEGELDEKCSVFSVQCSDHQKPETINHQPSTEQKTKSPVNNLPSGYAKGRCGWWIEIGVQPLVEALREAMSLSDKERGAMGKNGQALIKMKYTWAVVADKMKVVFENILSVSSE